MNRAMSSKRKIFQRKWLIMIHNREQIFRYTLITYLVDIGVVGIVIAFKHVAISTAIVVVVFRPIYVLEVVGNAWLADAEFCKGTVPTLHRLFETIAAKIIATISAAVVFQKEITEYVFYRDGIIASG